MSTKTVAVDSLVYERLAAAKRSGDRDQAKAPATRNDRPFRAVPGLDLIAY